MTKKKDDLSSEVKSEEIQPAKLIYYTRHAHSKSNEMGENWRGMKSSLKEKKIPQMNDATGSLKWMKPTRWNWMDTKVSAKGREQLKAMKKHTATFLKDHGIEVIIHSDRRRAATTCEELFGKEAKELSIKRIPSEAMREELIGEKVRPSNEKLKRRIKQFLEMQAFRKENRLLLVGHSKFFRTMINNMDFRIPNATTWSFGLSKSGEIIGPPQMVLGPDKLVQEQKECSETSTAETSAAKPDSGTTQLVEN